MLTILMSLAMSFSMNHGQVYNLHTQATHFYQVTVYYYNEGNIYENPFLLLPKVADKKNLAPFHEAVSPNKL